ncbi:hypothetical protein BKA69DRAFT_424795 [Paraphysoderma sedebokerense]|nr:hypothetical protein BKA69DRAFT_424271 [Paraphysoderma sedebokerense]KAI9141268.1 hypothetical protein BKA69DRAFT_424795 [Paraphysoderma sedebokerense]
MMSDDYKPESSQEQDSHPPPPEDRRGSYHSDRNSKSPQRQSQSDQDNYDQGGGGGPVRGGDSSYRRGGGYGGKPYGRPYDRPPRSYGGPPPQGGGPSSKDCRVYVGNLPYTLRWFELKDFCREAGEVVRAEILMLPNGRSKGCGIVEFRSPDDAKNAIKIFQDREMNGRPIFVREDREDFLKPSRPVLGFGRSYGFRPPPRGSFGPPPGPPNPCMVFVQNIPYSAHWQNLKDLFRDAGEVVKADVLVFPDSGRSRGVGTVIFETEAAAQNAICEYT